ncbi:MAG: hypothetical protein NUV75_12850 [Gallionella sp.]|nr:hypothetical protein [Gallionella sp.]
MEIFLKKVLGMVGRTPNKVLQPTSALLRRCGTVRMMPTIARLFAPFLCIC